MEAAVAVPAQPALHAVPARRPRRALLPLRGQPRLRRQRPREPRDRGWAREGEEQGGEGPRGEEVLPVCVQGPCVNRIYFGWERFC